MGRKLCGVCLLVLMVAATAVGQDRSEGAEIVREGIEAFEDAQYQQALVTFRELLVDARYEEFEDEARFWIAKSAMALGRLTEAEQNLEQFTDNYPDNPNYPEALYQKGRLQYLQGAYQKAIQAFERFVSRFPDSAFVANAYYWTGESLFELGRLDEAEEMFRSVVQDYPRSYRVEAAQYRLSVLDLTRREEELLKLLQWSHERYLEAVAEFGKQKQTFEEALQSYRDQLAGRAEEDYQAEIERLRSEVETLKERLAQQRTREETEQARPADREARVASGSERRLLRLKEQALALKEEIVDRIANETTGGNQ